MKIGSNVLARKDGKPNITNMSTLVDQVAYLKNNGHEIVMVSSGAVACGRGAVTPLKDLDSVASRQLFSAIGQVRLMNLYSQFFSNYGMVAAQILTQKDNFSSEEAYLNQKSCMLTMLENDVIPIVNENDTVSLTELMFTDNDELSGSIAAMINADMLVILSNVDGIFTGDPEDPASKLIPEIAYDESADQYLVESKSDFGRGGMSSKSHIASKVASEGIAVIIAKGDRSRVLIDLIENPQNVPHTLFRPSQNSNKEKKAYE